MTDLGKLSFCPNLHPFFHIDGRKCSRPSAMDVGKKSYRLSRALWALGQGGRQLVKSACFVSQRWYEMFNNTYHSMHHGPWPTDHHPWQAKKPPRGKKRYTKITKCGEKYNMTPTY